MHWPLLLLFYVYLHTGVIAVSNRNRDFPSLNVIKPSVDTITQQQSINQLIKRLIPKRSNEFIVYINSSLASNSPDAFELDTNGEVIYITGSSGVAAAHGFHHYLKYYCKVHVSWTGNQLTLPNILPKFGQKIYVEIPHKFRYYLNPCTFSYSMVWWDWERWQQEIDWMALNGINMPLAFTGQESIWYRVYQKLGLSLTDLNQFFTGPAFLAWNRMGNIQKWAGPLPHDDWVEQQGVLQKKILALMRSHGMTPVLPAFNGNVPNSLTKHYPKAQFTKSNTWFGFAGDYGETTLLDPRDNLFKKISKTFHQEQFKIYGSDHLYSIDLFNELDPKSRSSQYLSHVGRAVYTTLRSLDRKAIWIMQGWMFYYDAQFWDNEQIQAFLAGVPKGKIIILDLFAEVGPQYHRTKSFFGHPFIWCMLGNFGGNSGMYGTFETIAEGAIAAYDMENSSMVGIGMAPEGIENNYIMYDLMAEMSWRRVGINVHEWVAAYVERRYGSSDNNAIEAWLTLSESVYNCDDLRQYHCRSIPVIRPSLSIARDSWYDVRYVFSAWASILKANNKLFSETTFRHDVADITRQALQELCFIKYKKVITFYKKRDKVMLNVVGKELIKLLGEMDEIVGTVPHFLLGKWLKDAERHSDNTTVKQLLAFNARNQITLWGPSESFLHDYANRMWNGLIGSFYKHRWSMFVDALKYSLEKRASFDEIEFYASVQKFELKWGRRNTKFRAVARGNTINVSKRLHNKYSRILNRYIYSKSNELNIQN